MKNSTYRSSCLLFLSLKRLIVLVTSMAVIIPAYPGVFMLSEDRPQLEVITHPSGYTGVGGVLFVTIGIAPNSANRFEMMVPLLNAINTWNELTPTLRNVVAAADNNVLPGQFDFESVLLHELGHCIGLSHPHLASESGLLDEERNYTTTTRGADGVYNLDPGADGIIGSHDDQRGDDVNLHWFRKNINNPFTIAPRVDTTTYSRDLYDLPSGHLFVANGNLGTASLLGLANSEAVMQQGISAGETRRSLSTDDVATLRLAMSGFDGIAGTNDDYTVALEFVGHTDNADIVLNFDNSQTTFAACAITAIESPQPGHFVINKGNIFFRDDIAWFFNQEPTILPRLEITANGTSGSITVAQNAHILLEVSLFPSELLNKPADYWVSAETPMGTFWLNDRFEFIQPGHPVRAYGGPLILLNRFPILNSSVSGLPPGEYHVTFAVDNNENNIFEGSFQKSINITIVP